jgi:hypothetical protein
MQIDMFDPVSQNKAILKALKNGERLTPLDIFKRFNSLRASARIFDIRDMGYDVGTDMVKRGTKRVAEYYLKN